MPVPFEKHLRFVDSVTAVGERLLVGAVHDNGLKLYTVDRKTLAGSRYRPVGDATEVTVMQTLAAGAVLRVNSAADGYAFYLTDGTEAGTRRLTAFAPLGDFDFRTTFLQADAETLYALASQAPIGSSADPEASQTGGGGSYQPTSSTIGRIDLRPGAAPGASRLTSISAAFGESAILGDAIYVRYGDTRSAQTFGVARIDLATGYFADVGTAAGNLLFADGKPLFATAPDATALSTGTVRGGRVDVGVFIDNDAAKSLTGDERFDFELYLDRNRNGRLDGDEIASDGIQLWDFDKAGTYSIGVVPKPNWEATRGWTRTVKVRDGKATPLAFGVRDTLKTGTLAGNLHVPSGTPAEQRTVWIDLDDDGTLDAAEPRTLLGPSVDVPATNFQFHGLAAGVYVVRRVGSATRFVGEIREPGDTAKVTDGA